MTKPTKAELYEQVESLKFKLDIEKTKVKNLKARLAECQKHVTN